MSKKTETQLIDATFLDLNNKEVKVSDYITTDDCWFLKRQNKWILTHKAIQKLANVAGISKNFDVQESSIKPEYSNELSHIVRVTIKCNAINEKLNADSCFHGERSLTITGEANRINTSNRGRGYLRKMAEKRGYDMAVLQHLGLDSLIFSEEESEDFEKEKEVESITDVDLKFLKDEISLIASSKNRLDLDTALSDIKKMKSIKKYSNTQLSFLKEMHLRKLQEFEDIF